jgi:hypothetical protein
MSVGACDSPDSPKLVLGVELPAGSERVAVSVGELHPAIESAIKATAVIPMRSMDLSP